MPPAGGGIIHNGPGQVEGPVQAFYSLSPRPEAWDPGAFGGAGGAPGRATFFPLSV